MGRIFPKRVTIAGLAGRVSLLLLLIAAAWVAWTTYRVVRGYPPAAEIVRPLPDLVPIDVVDADRFLNDLKLSPWWGVVKERDGAFVAQARPVRSPKPGQFPFPPLDVRVLFRAPEPSVDIAVRGEPATLRVRSDYGHPFQVGPNSLSRLAIRLSTTAEIYLELMEPGGDPQRTATFSSLPRIVEHLAELNADLAPYRVETRYQSFFDEVFPGPRKDAELARIPGIQERDTFHGYFRTRPGTSYEGVNVLIWEPKICHGECTRSFERFDKAEYLGKPYEDGDLVYFRIADNAVYLDPPNTQRYGWFSGKESFEGRIEILNDALVVLLETRGPFRGWER